MTDVACVAVEHYDRIVLDLVIFVCLPSSRLQQKGTYMFAVWRGQSELFRCIVKVILREVDRSRYICPRIRRDVAGIDELILLPIEKTGERSGKRRCESDRELYVP